MRKQRPSSASVRPTSLTVVARHTDAVTAVAVGAGWIASAGRDAVVSRAHHDGRGFAAAESTSIGAAALALALDDDGGFHAVTRTGTATRWSKQARPVTEIDHGIRDGIRLDASCWVLAHEDGTIVIDSLRPHTLDEPRRHRLVRRAFYFPTASDLVSSFVVVTKRSIRSWFRPERLTA